MNIFTERELRKVNDLLELSVDMNTFYLLLNSEFR